MGKAHQPAPSNTIPAAPGGTAERFPAPAEVAQLRLTVEQLRQRLSETEAELETARQAQKWLETALASQRHARQILESSIAAGYDDTIAHIRERVRALVPPGEALLVISKGDPTLIRIADQTAWHFPRGADGEFLGYNPADSGDAIRLLNSQILLGAHYLVIPDTAFWWLEHYRDWAHHLEQTHARIWRDTRCIIYRLDPAPARKSSQATAPNQPGMEAALVKNHPADPSERPDVVCLPVINWNYRFQRPQQLMLQFARAGHRVFYVSHEFRKSGPPFEVRQLAENLWEVSLRGAGFKIRDGLLDEESQRALFHSLVALHREYRLEHAAAIVQLAFWWPLARAVAPTLGWSITYDCMDHQAGFSNHNPAMLAEERELLTQADLVVASSVPLEEAARQYNSNVLLVRNGCDFEHFAQAAAPASSERPVIGYFGAISDWFDTQLVADLAERRPDWEFILVGSTVSADVSRLSRLPNVQLPGEKPYLEIPEWLKRFSVTLLPFKRNPLTHATNPVKAYEIFASGKALISVPLPEILPLAPLARIATTAEEFERAIEEELRAPDAGLRERRRSFARQNTWRNRFEMLAPALRQTFTQSSYQKRLATAPAEGLADK